MNFLTICALLGCDISGTGREFLPRDKAQEALEIHRRLCASPLPLSLPFLMAA
jgi:hypothetical protein